MRLLVNTGKRVELPRRCHHVGIRTGKKFRHQPEPGDQPATASEVSYFPFEAAAALSMTRLTSVPLPVPRSCAAEDRKSTRLNSSHLVISYAVFCLKKKIQ